MEPWIVHLVCYSGLAYALSHPRVDVSEVLQRTVDPMNSDHSVRSLCGLFHLTRVFVRHHFDHHDVPSGRRLSLHLSLGIHEYEFQIKA